MNTNTLFFIYIFEYFIKITFVEMFDEKHNVLSPMPHHFISRIITVKTTIENASGKTHNRILKIVGKCNLKSSENTN